METTTIPINKSKEQIELEAKIIDIICDKLGVDKIEVISTATFKDDLGADSLDTVELIMEFEKQFDIKLPDEEAEKIKTVGEATIAVISKMIK